MARIRDVSGMRKVRLIDGWGLCATQPNAAFGPDACAAPKPGETSGFGTVTR